MPTYSNGTVKTVSADASTNPPVYSFSADFEGPPPMTKSFSDITKVLWDLANEAFDGTGVKVDVEALAGPPETVVRVTKKK